MVIPNWKKKRPMIPVMKATGRKMATTAMVAASAAKVISRAPSREASTLLLPISRWRMMFSSTMIASSTTMPMASDRPSKVKKLSVKPMKYSTMNVPMTEVGMESRTLKVELARAKKKIADEAGDERPRGPG